MSKNKEIFLNWLKDKKVPNNEIDHNLADKNELKFNNHALNADSKEFVNPERLENSFKLIIKSSY